MSIPSFDEFIYGLSPQGPAVSEIDPEARIVLEQAANAFAALPYVDRKLLVEIIEAHPEWTPAIGYTVGLSQEQLKNQLRYHLGSGGWVRLARENAAGLIAMLDDNFDAVSQIEAQRHAVWDYPAVLVERAAARSKASRSVSRGRDLEDQVEAVANVLGLAYELRTRFLGRGDDSAPADLAIPQGGRNAQIVIAVKGFDSTGSKLTDAVREIEAMASVRSPTQFVFAFIDGIGWLSRRKDVRAIYDLWLSNRIDGVYTVATLSKLEDALSAAKLRLDL